MNYLPFGYKEQTSEQIKKQTEKFRLYDYYGIPYGIFDESQITENNKIESDREKARLMIMKGEDIPKELAEQLLKYKKENLYNKKNNN